MITESIPEALGATLAHRAGGKHGGCRNGVR